MLSRKPGDALLGIVLYSIGVFFFTVNDALGKWLVADYSVAELMALRGVGALIVLGPALGLTRARFAAPHQWVLQSARVACSAIDTFCFYFATRSLPLADVMAFYLAAPLIVVALSSAVLGERVGAGRWAAVLVGFVGVVIALHPSTRALAPVALIALLGSSMFAVTITITRRLRATPWLELVTFQVVGSSLLGALGAPSGWVTPSILDFALMTLVGIVSMVCFMCITKALAIAPASLLAPFQYTSIVWAALMGWMVFGDVPGSPVILGSAVIIGSGLFVLRREGAGVAAPAGGAS